ncbi:MAG: pyridoxamine 5'-phosphate oxidase family protein, partial [Deltaproteobacteria bacterium]
CGWTMRYRSVIGYGIAGFIEDPGEKRAALDVIMRRYAEGTHGYSDQTLRMTVVIKVEIREISGKKSGPFKRSGGGG